MKKITLILFLAIFSIACNEQKTTHKETHSSNGRDSIQVYRNLNSHNVDTISYSLGNQSVKNIILLIGDGMGLNVIQSAWVANGGKLYMREFPYIGLMTTTAQDSIITDSAASGTAMATGTKTNRGYVGVDAQSNSLTTICELAKKKGLSTGVISTCRIVDATPATFSIENIDRNDSEVIAESYLQSNIDFILGGGRNFFDNRKDKQNLIPDFQKKNYTFAPTLEALDSVNYKKKVLALIAGHDMPDAIDRGDDLWKGTKKALEYLSNNKKGFFLMVESGMIDDYGHHNNIKKMMEETLDFDRTIGNVMKWANKHPGTLVIVTADHGTGGLTLIGGSEKNHEIMVKYSTNDHDGVFIPVFAFGAKADLFTGNYDNTDLFKKMKELLIE